MRPYIVDSNFFIQAHRVYYPIDVMTSFWEKVKELANQRLIKSIDKVKDEIYSNSSHQDALKTWCIDNLPNDFFINTNSVILEYAQIAQWTNSHTRYTQNAKEEFLAAGLADPWLVAYSINQNCTIVTYEKSRPDSKKRIKIPEVCNQFNVNFVDTIEMLRALNEVI